jgi:hypothetical protein
MRSLEPMSAFDDLQGERSCNTVEDFRTECSCAEAEEEIQRRSSACCE